MRHVTLALLLLAPLVEAAELRGAARGWLGPGIDTNPARETLSPGYSTLPDGFLYGLVQLEGSVDFEKARVAATYDIAARKFVAQAAQDTLVQSAQVETTVALGRSFAAGLAGRARDRRGADRDYSDLIGEAVVDFRPDDAVDVRLRVGAHRFLYWPRFAYSFWGPDGSLTARYRFNRRHSASLFGNLNPRQYNALRNQNPADTEPPPRVIRTDSVWQAGVSYSYRGPFHLTVGYAYYDQASNSFAETLRRHRLFANLGLRLPWALMLFGTLTLQLGLFPEGVYVTPELQLGDDDENSSSGTLKLVKPLTKHIDFDLRYAIYVNVLPKSGYVYLRQVASVGVAVNF